MGPLPIRAAPFSLALNRLGPRRAVARQTKPTELWYITC